MSNGINLLITCSWVLIEVDDGLVTKSCPTLATPLTIGHQAPLSMAFSKQGSWSGLPFPSPEDQKLTYLHVRSSCLENSMNRRAWPATVHGAVESDTTEQLSLSLSLTHTHTGPETS